MSDPPASENNERWKPAAFGCLWGIGTWVVLVGIALLCEDLFNSGRGAGPGSPGMPPIPAFFFAAVLLGWIPAGIAGFWRYRYSRKK
ncbi:MAG: hypothetical protein KDA70_21155 [Planctomycetaceae bacterium]|nr:hypothetical protein [Planctomycetaceae bacterium]